MRWFGCVAILALGTIHGQDRQPGQGVNFYSNDKEIALGQQLALEFRKNTTPLDNAAVREYVTRVGANLAAQLPGGWTYQFELIQGDRGGATHEPTAFPGGYIFVSPYMITAAQNEAEFAGMLAHAMAHAAARHWTRLATKGDLTQIGMQVSAANMSNSNGVGVPLGMLAFQRANEREADFIAVKAMADAGYDPAGLATYVERLQPRAGATEGVFQTLPDREERVFAIQTEIQKLPRRTYSSGEDFARVKAEVKPAAAAAPTLIRK